MNAKVKDCPQPDYPIRERAYTPEQQAHITDADLARLSRSRMTRDDYITEAIERMDADTIHELLFDNTQDDDAEARSDLVDLQLLVIDASWILDQIMRGKSLENVASEPTGSPERRDNGLIAIRNLARRSDELYRMREDLVSAESVRLVDES